MRTRTQLEPRIPLIALAAVLAVAATVSVLSTSLRMGEGNGETSIPADVQSLATEIAPIGPDGTIAAAEAIAAFEREMGPWNGADITTFLVHMTSRELPAVSDRDVWVLKYDGVQLPVSLPDVPDGVKLSWPNGTPTAGTVLYAFVDAKTGEWLAATNGAP
jgi:hypothetical protein